MKDKLFLKTDFGCWYCSMFGSVADGIASCFVTVSTFHVLKWGCLCCFVFYTKISIHTCNLHIYIFQCNHYVFFVTKLFKMLLENFIVHLTQRVKWNFHVCLLHFDMPGQHYRETRVYHGSIKLDVIEHTCG